MLQCTRPGLECAAAQGIRLSIRYDVFPNVKTAVPFSGVLFCVLCNIALCVVPEVQSEREVARDVCCCLRQLPQHNCCCAFQRTSRHSCHAVCTLEGMCCCCSGVIDSHSCGPPAICRLCPVLITLHNCCCYVAAARYHRLPSMVFNIVSS